MNEGEKEKNLTIGRELCEELRRNGLARTALAVDSGENDDTDLWLVVDGRKIAVELSGYHRDNAFARAESAGGKLQGLATRELEKIKTLNGIRAFIAYRRTESPSRGPSVEVPRNHLHHRFVDECQMLLHELAASPGWQTEQYTVLLFDKPPLPAVMMEQRDYCPSPIVQVDPVRFATLAESCHGLMVRRTPEYCFLLLESELNRLSRPPDERVIRDLVRKKLKRLPDYREKAAGAECWLVIHSERHTLPAWVHTSDMPMLAAAAGDELSKSTVSFDAVYLFNRDQVGLMNAVTRIMPQKPVS